MEGFVVDPPNSSISFTSLFDKIIVIWNKETLIWDKMSSKMEMVSSQGGDPLPLECSGFEVNRIGWEEDEIKIVLFFSLQSPMFGVSEWYV